MYVHSFFCSGTRNKSRQDFTPHPSLQHAPTSEVMQSLPMNHSWGPLHTAWLGGANLCKWQKTLIQFSITPTAACGFCTANCAKKGIKTTDQFSPKLCQRTFPLIKTSAYVHMSICTCNAEILHLHTGLLTGREHLHRQLVNCVKTAIVSLSLC